MDSAILAGTEDSKVLLTFADVARAVGQAGRQAGRKEGRWAGRQADRQAGKAKVYLSRSLSLALLCKAEAVACDKVADARPGSLGTRWLSLASLNGQRAPR
jgi:predicted transposase YdaD